MSVYLLSSTDLFYALHGTFALILVHRTQKKGTQQNRDICKCSNMLPSRFQNLICSPKPLANGFVKIVNIDKIDWFSLQNSKTSFKKASKPKRGFVLQNDLLHGLSILKKSKL
jgi:hypothetical protein